MTNCSCPYCGKVDNYIIGETKDGNLLLQCIKCGNEFYQLGADYCIPTTHLATDTFNDVRTKK